MSPDGGAGRMCAERASAGPARGVSSIYKVATGVRVGDAAATRACITSRPPQFRASPLGFP
jgi:hypothetical protein